MDNYKYRRFFSSLPNMATPRLQLKKITSEYIADMYEYASLDEVTEYLLWSPHLNMADTKGYIDYLAKQYKRGNYADWALVLSDVDKMIGTCGFSNLDFDNNKGEIGYVLSPKYRHNGYMTEALNVLLHVAFVDLSLARVEAHIIEENTASSKLCLSLGFSFEGTQRKSMLIKGKYRNISYYSMLAEEYFLNEK